ncbi:MAG: D-malate dehydrogenase [decarboxylating] [Myxococcota bacterium]|nr:D-malate dehydrogenase [decarboxylating] [Myxococcota bacterium]
MGKTRIAVIPGDGIGKEVIAEGCKVLEALDRRFGLGLSLEYFPWSADHYLATGVTLPDEQIETYRNDFAAIYLGAVGDPRVPSNQHAKDILLGMRFKLDLYVNLRPVSLIDERLCPLKGKQAKDVQITIFRENTEDLYVEVGGVFKQGTPDEVAINESINTRKGVERIIRRAFEYARDRKLGRVCMSDKANVLRYGHGLWQRVFREVRTEFPEIQSRHMYVDALCMEIIRAPENFDVIVTSNMFGDIITDLGAALAGGLGVAASGNIHPGGIGLFEPVHGSAPDIAGKGLANPVGAISTAALMLDYLGFKDAARVTEQAVADNIRAGYTTPDLGGTLSTAGAGDCIIRRIAEIQ